jgi:transposase
MFIDLSRNNGKLYLRLVNSVRVKNKEGFSIPQKQVILNIGPLGKFDDGKPDYITRLRKSFKAGSPLIESLKPYCNSTPPEEYDFRYKEGDPACFGNPKLVSHLLIERIVEELGLHTFFRSYKNFTKIKFNVYSFFKLMVAGRILNPASKLATIRQNEEYYEPILDQTHNPDNIYDTLTFIANNHDKILRRMNTNLVKKMNRNPEIIFYDVTNFYFEIERPDDDEIDDVGNITEKGLRKMGVCKEERKLPIVQMGLFMDDNGIPIAINSFPGNTLDHQTLRASLSNSIDNLELTRFILIADRGVYDGPNILQTLDTGNGYIMARSLLKSKKTDREWTYQEDGYVNVGSDFKYKSRVVRRNVKDENGCEREITEKVVVYWSKKFADRNRKEHESFLAFLEKLENSPANFRISATQARSLKKFLDKKLVNKETGELIESSKILPLLDKEKIENYKKSFGYYQLVTSELTLGDQEVIDKYHGLSEIENQFRIMKGDLETRPLHVSTPEHIKAHLLICMIALTVMRIIQIKIANSELARTKEEKKVKWSMGLSGERIQQALRRWQVDLMPGDLYRFMGVNHPDLKLILDSFGIEILPTFYRRAELKQIKTSMEKIM